MNQPDDPGNESREQVLVKRLRALVGEVNAAASQLQELGIEVEFDKDSLRYIGQTVAFACLTVTAKKVL